MRIADIVQESMVDGPGLRVTVFTQGCLHHCVGCHNPETHDPYGGDERSVVDVITQLADNPLIRGLTLSGGEPFLQAEPCAALAREAHARGWDVWTYTGFRYEQIRDSNNPHWQALLDETDVLVDGPFLESEKSYSLRFRGSRNQRLIDVAATAAEGQVILWKPRSSLLPFLVPES